MQNGSPVAILFDLDGTLIDSIGLLLESVHHAFATHEGRRPTTEEWVAGIGRPLEWQIRPYVRSDEELDAIRDAYRTYQRANHDRLTKAYQQVPEVVAGLRARGHPMALVTSKISELANRSLAWVGLAEHFDVVVGADATTLHKPDPAPVWYALERLGVPAERAMFVGDSPHDMAAGNAAGVVTVAALWGPFTRAQLEPSAPSHWLERVDELPALVERAFPG
jgi:pyrophosphatase PpaX